MTEKTEAQQIFDTVLTLGYGETVELTFPLATAADSFRSALYRERKNWAMATGSKDQINIIRDYSSFPFKISISKLPGTMGAVIKKQDGSITDIQFSIKPKEPVYTQEDKSKTEIEHQKDLMRNDGMSEEDIDAYFGEDLE